MEIEIAGQQALLLPEKALYFPENKTLVVADVHWGKAGHFRKHGIAIPAKSTGGNAERLSGVILKTSAQTVVFAGDLFHSRHNNEVEAFREWRAHFPQIRFELVVGNHDILSEAFYERCNLELFPEKKAMNGISIWHDAPVESNAFVIHGHIHPGIKLFGKGRQQVAVPCFAIDDKRLILPAFGDFTGCFYLNPRDFRQLYAVTDTAVMQVK